MTDYYGPLTAPGTANSTTSGLQTLPRGAKLLNGYYAVVWEDHSGALSDTSGTAIRARLIDASGTTGGGEFQVNTVISGDQTDPTVAARRDYLGGFVVAWTGSDSSGTGIKAQLFNSSGGKEGAEFQVNTTASDNQSQARAVDVPGVGFVIVWLDLSGAGSAIRGQFYLNNGSRYGSEFLVVSKPTEALSEITVAPVAYESRIVVGWTEANGDLDGSAAMAAVVSPTYGMLTTTPVSESTAGNQLDSSVAAHAPSRGYVVAYVDAAGPGDSGAVKVRMFTHFGTAAGPDLQVTADGESGTDPSVLVFDSGMFAVSWRDSAGVVRVQMVTGSGDKLGDPLSVSDGAGEYATLMPSGAESFVVTWSDGDIRTRLYEPVEPAVADILISDTTLTEGIPEHLPVAQLGATGIGGSSGFTYSIRSDSTGGAFAIEGDRLVVADGSLIDFETAPEAQVTIRATDQQGRFRDETFTLTIADAAIEPDEWTASGLITPNDAAHGPREPDISGLAGGGFVMVYFDSRFSSGEHDGSPLRGRIFSASGTRIGEEFEVAVHSDGNHHPLIVAGLAGGGFVVLFSDYRDGQSWSQAQAQIFDSEGNAVSGQFEVGTNPEGGQDNLAVAALPSGGFVVTWNNGWSGKVPTVSDIRAQIYDSTGAKLGAEIIVPSTHNWMQRDPAVAVLEDGGFVIAFTDANGAAVLVQRFDPAGGRIGDTVRVSPNVGHLKFDPTVTGLAGGGFAISWTEGVGYGGGDPNPMDIKVRVYNSSGSPVGDAFVAHDELLGGQRMGIVIPLEDGGFVVTWNEHPSPDGHNRVEGVTKAQMFNALGEEVGGEIQVNAQFAEEHFLTGAAALPWGGFVVGYSDLSGNTPGFTATISARIFAPVGFDANDDTVVTDEATILEGSVFADNGSGADVAPAAGRAMVESVEGSAADVGKTIELDSGALLRLNADGTFSYDPNHAFDSLAFHGSGGSNREATDSFSYKLAGGDTATVTVTVRGLYSAPHLILGTPDSETLTGTGSADIFDGRGGEDTALGGAGNDVIYFGSALSSGDVADGGEGRDAVVLQGNVTAVLTDSNLVGIESISIQSGANTRFGDTANNLYDFDITTADGNVLAGQQLIVNAQSLRADEDFTFDGSAESDGRFLIYGGHGVDNLTGGDGVDVFLFEGSRWGPHDRVDGGGGRDSLTISGGSGLTHIEFGADSFTNIESISLNNRYASDPSQKPSYDIVLHNGNVAPGATLIVNGSSIPLEQVVNIDGRGVRDGNLILFGGGGHDVMLGGEGADLLIGSGGADALTGGAGADTFRYDSASDSVAGREDLIGDFQSGSDRFDLSRVDADSGAPGDQAFTWIGSNAFTGVAGELRTYEQGGYRWIEGDTDGDGDGDLVIALQPGAPLVQGDFLL
jgi:Ca2+-binding RTX toxin-like protein